MLRPSCGAPANLGARGPPAVSNAAFVRASPVAALRPASIVFANFATPVACARSLAVSPRLIARGFSIQRP